jgi:hypothetical protein
MSSKINISQIAMDHLATLRNERTGRISALDLAIFVLMPFLLALAYYFLGWSLSKDATNLIITGMSIFAGLMINVLVLIYTVALNTKTESETAEEAVLERRFLRQIFANISFSISTSVLIVIILGLSFFVGSKSQSAVSAIAFFLLGNFLLTLLMTLKRLHILLSKRFS